MRRLVLAALFACLAAPVAGATVDLAPPEARVAARRALLAGDDALAGSIARALLERDPGDASALSVLAALAGRAGRIEEGRRLAVRAFNAAREPALRYEAARLAAEGAAAAGAYGRAASWSRRAASTATTPEQRATAIEAYRQARALDPWRVQLSGSLAPSSNVNQGSNSATLIVDGVPTPFTLSGDALALSGIVASLDVAARYRFAERPTAASDVTMRLISTRIALDDLPSPADGERQPQGSDYAYTAIEAGLQQSFAAAADAPLTVLGATAGRSWYADTPFADYFRLGAARSFALGQRVGARTALTVERQWRTDGGDDATAVVVEGALSWAVAARDSATVSLALTDLNSQGPSDSYRGASAGLDYALGRPVGPLLVTLGLGASYRDYPTFFGGFFNDTGRQDRRLSGSIELVAPAIELRGFVPAVTVTASRTWSNVSRFDATGLGLAFGLRAAF